MAESQSKTDKINRTLDIASGMYSLSLAFLLSGHTFRFHLTEI